MFFLGLIVGLLAGLIIGARFSTSLHRKKDHHLKPENYEYGTNVPSFQQGNEFMGKKIVFAGALAMIDLSEAIWCVSKLGGVVTTDINSETDILVVGENPEWSIMEQIEGIDRLRETPIVLMEELEFVTTIDEYFDLGNVKLD